MFYVCLSMGDVLLYLRPILNLFIFGWSFTFCSLPIPALVNSFLRLGMHAVICEKLLQRGVNEAWYISSWRLGTQAVTVSADVTACWSEWDLDIKHGVMWPTSLHSLALRFVAHASGHACRIWMPRVELCCSHRFINLYIFYKYGQCGGVV